MPQAIQTLVNNIITSNKVINVSNKHWQEVLERINSCESTRLREYLIALACDIEVAIQEKNLIQMAAKLGFEYILHDYIDKPSFHYEEEFPIDGFDLAKEQIVDGNIYVINTHGAPGQIDGPFQKALQSDLNLKRIVLDACSSAVKKNGKSMIANVASQAIKKNLNDDIEVVGYTYNYTANETHLTGCGAFAKAEYLKNKRGIKLVTLTEQQAQENKKLNKTIGKMSTNNSLFFNQTVISLHTHLLHVMSALYSKLVSTFITKDTINSTNTLCDNLISTLITLSIDAKNIYNKLQETKQYISEQNKRPATAIKQLLKTFKLERKKYFASLSDEQLVNTANNALSLARELNESINDNELHVRINLVNHYLKKYSVDLNKCVIEKTAQKYCNH